MCHLQEQLMTLYEHQTIEVPYNSFSSVPTMISYVPTFNSSYIMDQDRIAIAGFQDCTEEAIRYLVDVENFSEDDPTILGLKQHLWERQNALNFDKIVRDIASNNSAPSSPVAPSTHGHSDDEQDSVYGHSDEHITDMDQSDLTDMTDMSNSSGIVTDSECLHSNSMLGPLSPPVSDQHSEGEDLHHQGDDMFDNVFTLASLAQNNPAIASLTEELMTLLEEEEHEDDSSFNISSRTDDSGIL